MPDVKLAAALGIKRVRDLRRRVLPPLVEAGVVECSGASEAGTVSLTRDWREALELERERAGELEAERRDLERYERERDAYRNRHRIRPEPVPEYVSGTVEELEPVPNVDRELVEALGRYLARHPHRRRETASWLSVALWADEFMDWKPPPEAVADALDHLSLRAA